MKPSFLLIFLLAVALIIAGCASQDQGASAGQANPTDQANPAPTSAPSGNGQGPPYPGRGGFGNATDRAAINLVMTQACAGLVENASCTFTIPGGRSGNGTCRDLNGSLFCRGMGGGFRQRNGTSPFGPPTN